jgi:transcriptional regulator with XRE-family HTH domain
MGAEAFASRLRELREAAGLTQQALADRAELHRESLAKIERGERIPGWDTVLALAKALGVPCTAFVGPEDGPAVEEPATAPRRAGRPRKAEVEDQEEAAPPKAKRGRKG